MSGYRQLSLEERCAIARLHEDGQSFRQIAAALDRQPSTIAREVKRNSGSKLGYRPAYAQQLAAARKWSGSRLERSETLRNDVLARLAAG